MEEEDELMVKMKTNVMMMVAALPGSVGCAARQDGQDGMSWVCNKPVKIKTQELELILLKS